MFARYRATRADMRSRIAGFVPTELFSATEDGFWFDFSDLSTLFQDAAGTTPVESDSDPVGLVVDKSGRGNNASQSVSASRPLYKTDGTAHWLQFDGVDDFLDFGNILNLGTSNKTMGVAINSGSTSNGEILSCRGSNAPGVNPGWGFRSDEHTLQLEYDDGTPSSIAGPIGDMGDAGALNPDSVHIAEIEHGVEARSYLNNVLSATTVDISGIGDVSNNLNPLGIGQTSGDVFYFTGIMYGMVFIDRLLTATERAQVNRYLSIKAGL